MDTSDNAEIELREELGLTQQRGAELDTITQSIMDQCSKGEQYGRVSHVLLEILSRKDLSDLEKVTCTYIFCRRTGGVDEEPSDDNRSAFPEIFPEISEIVDIGNFSKNVSGVVIAPKGIDQRTLVTISMAALVAIIRQLPEKDARIFCMNASMSFMRMARTGDMSV